MFQLDRSHPFYMQEWFLFVAFAAALFVGIAFMAVTDTTPSYELGRATPEADTATVKVVQVEERNNATVTADGQH